MTAKKDMTEAERDRHHAERMGKRKAARDRMLATKTEEKGLLMVHTGKGKGKSTAAFGLAVRAMGNDMRVGVVQFVKGKWQTGERAILEHFPERVTIRTMGEGFTWDTQDRQRDIAAAKAAWQAAQEMMADESYDLIVLDELNIVLRYDYLPLSEIVAALQARREGLHIMVTGRNAKEALIEAADMVTEMSEIKHHFKAGVKAQTGIEF
jgi:cob(I)alamin adenosyltransferase